MKLTPLEKKFLDVANRIMRKPRDICHCPPSMDGTVRHGVCPLNSLERVIFEAESKRGERGTENTTGAHRMRESLQLIATPMRNDGTWNRDREACRQLAEETLKLCGEK